MQHVIQPTGPMWVTYYDPINFRKDPEGVEWLADPQRADVEGPGDLMSGPYRLVAWVLTERQGDLGIPRPIGSSGDCSGIACVGDTAAASRAAAHAEFQDQIMTARAALARRAKENVA